MIILIITIIDQVLAIFSVDELALLNYQSQSLGDPLFSASNPRNVVVVTSVISISCGPLRFQLVCS